MSNVGACRRLGVDFDSEFIDDKRAKLIAEIQKWEANYKDLKHCRKIALCRIVKELRRAKTKETGQRTNDVTYSKTFLRENLDRAIADHRAYIHRIIVDRRKQLKIYDIMTNRRVKHNAGKRNQGPIDTTALQPSSKRSKHEDFEGGNVANVKFSRNKLPPPKDSSDEESGDEEDAIAARPTFESDHSNKSIEELQDMCDAQLKEIDDLKALVDEQQVRIKELENEMKSTGSTKKKKEKKKLPKADGPTEDKLLKEMRLVLKQDIIHVLTNQPKHWEKYSDNEESMCQIIMSRMNEWPASADATDKMRLWNKLLGPNLNRSWSVTKNEILQRIRKNYLESECVSCFNNIAESVLMFMP